MCIRVDKRESSYINEWTGRFQRDVRPFVRARALEGMGVFTQLRKA